MPAEKILIVDDEELPVKLLQMLLERRGYEVVVAYRAEDGLRKAYSHQPDLILLDIMMPDMDGWEACRRLRELSDVPIIFLTAKSDKRDIVRGLEMGADDYIVKPYENEELLARVKVHLRRIPKPPMAEELKFDTGQFEINFISREVRVRGKTVHLTPKEFNLLGVLARNAGRVITRADLVREAWGPEYGDATDSLKLYIHYLRQKVEPDPQHPVYILTSRGIGYRFSDV
ncbi:MAG TPA: response regulator transcription factor [Aggregatilinea sp.]|jgi:two-component system KDP operon response regulator KdpE|uniref:response regulator transcription factor n=1 Tax=Aggregatilinea sp. TaxID=2806333 RepID=UPI002C29A110|nr:response regulator transcription factor [Aggregatilinea sp.]HML22807.1 response regulator transcription factor [Aggregatilinea sp.]